MDCEFSYLIIIHFIPFGSITQWSPEASLWLWHFHCSSKNHNFSILCFHFVIEYTLQPVLMCWMNLHGLVFGFI